MFMKNLLNPYRMASIGRQVIGPISTILMLTVGMSILVSTNTERPRPRLEANALGTRFQAYPR
jgi:hypothetical protein